MWGALYVQVTFFWTPLQVLYLADYLGPHGQESSAVNLLVIDYATTSRIATSADVVPDPRTDVGWRLSDAARQAGARRFKWVLKKGRTAELQALLQERVYRGRTAWQLVRLAVLGPILIVTGFCIWLSLPGRLSRRN